mmetsp:Transcript_31352/g.62417  ORF Transcript_31352/g.62417 Transcript_31352/m.62417 type:complete len:219 (-) Transcript_31352:383-1039(-)
MPLASGMAPAGVGFRGLPLDRFALVGAAPAVLAVAVVTVLGARPLGVVAVAAAALVLVLAAVDVAAAAEAADSDADPAGGTEASKDLPELRIEVRDKAAAFSSMGSIISDIPLAALALSALFIRSLPLVTLPLSFLPVTFPLFCLLRGFADAFMASPMAYALAARDRSSISLGSGTGIGGRVGTKVGRAACGGDFFAVAAAVVVAFAAVVVEVADGDA